MKPTGVVWAVLIFAAASHFLVDAIAGTVTPLWPSFETEFRLAPWQSAGILFVWQMTTSLGQLAFGFWGDKRNTRWLLWVGPFVALLSLGSIGWISSPTMLMLQVAIGGLAIASFHPEGAALAGNCATAYRSRAMSIFSLGGFIGQAVGPIFSGQLVDRLGLTGLIWSIPIGIAIATLLIPVAPTSLGKWSQPPQREKKIRLVARGQVRTILMVLAVGSLRLIAASGVPVLVGFLMSARGSSPGEIGFVQSGFMIGIGVGGLTCATLIHPKHEWTVLWICPCLVTPVLVATPFADNTFFRILVTLSGILLGTSLPVLVSFGQQLMPDAQRLASAITMGASWGLGGAAVAAILAVSTRTQHFEGAFVVFAVATACSGLLCAGLPRDYRTMRTTTATPPVSRTE